MTPQYKVSFFAFLFSLFFFLPHAAHGRLAVHHIHRPPPPHNQLIHRQVIKDPLSGLGNILSSVGNSPDPGGTSSPPHSSNTAPDSSPATTAPTATPTPSSSDPHNAASPLSVLSPSSPSSSPSPQTSDPSPSSSPASSSSSPSPRTSDPPPSSHTASTSSSPPSTSNPPPSPPTSDSTPTSSPAISSPQSSQPPSSPSTSSPPTATCPLGVDLHGKCILPPASTDVPPTSAPSSKPQTPTSLTSSSGTPAAPLLSNNPTSLPSPSSNAPTSSPSPSSNAPASSAPPESNTPASSPSPSSDTPTSPLSSNIPIPPLSSNTPNSLPPPSASSPPPASSTNLLSPSAAPQTTQSAPASSPPPDNQSSSPSPTHSSAPIDPCGPLGLALGLCTTSGTPTRASIPSSGSILQQSLTPVPTSQLPSSLPSFESHSQSPPVSTLGSSSSGASSSSGPSLPLPSAAPISSQSGTSSAPGSLSQSASGTAVESSTAYSGTNSASLNPSSSAPVISFPSYTTSPNDQTTSPQSTSASSSTPVFKQNSQFSYVTVSSLLGTFPSSSIPPTLTNPDAATTTLSLPDSSSSAAGPVSSAPLPADLPARIYPADLVNPSAVPSGDVLCSLLFTSFLPWNFVATHTQSQGQIFSWTPLIISQALNISSTDTPPFALQVFVPDSYQGPNDAQMLRTEYLFYLPSNLVPVLANEIRVQSSPFYNIAEPYKDLASQVDPGFALTSVPNPNAVPGTTSAASSRGNKSRTATIIGVVSALGGLALVILGILIFNGVKRSRQLRHQRLSDSNLPNDPYPDRTGRDFDQDSVGGPRRRSFYFAEDSLRGQPQTAEQSTVPMAQGQTQYVVQPGSQIQYSSRSSPENMRERRAPVVPGTISAPILTQSSLNW